MFRYSYLLVAIALLLGTPAVAGTIDWADWTSATVGNPGTASGTLPVSGVSVSYSGEIAFAQTAGNGTDYWNERTNDAYLVPNSPPDSDIITLQYGGNTVRNTVTFSTPVLNPVMAIMSLGRTDENYWVRYYFDTPFDVIRTGAGYWDTGATGSLIEETGNVLLGKEGHGVIQFQGEISSFSWYDDPAEYWHGFTVGIEGIRTSGVVPVPSPLLLGGLGLIGLALRRRWRR